MALSDGDDWSDGSRPGKYEVVNALEECAEGTGLDPGGLKKLEENLRRKFNLPVIEGSM